MPGKYMPKNSRDCPEALTHRLRGGSSGLHQIAQESIFLNVAKQWFVLKQASVSAKHAEDICRSLEKDILPSTENVPVQDIKARLLIQVLEPTKARGALETVRRLVQRINEIMIYAVNTGLIEANPASGIGNAFERPKSSICRLYAPKNCLS